MNNMCWCKDCKHSCEINLASGDGNSRCGNTESPHYKFIVSEYDSCKHSEKEKQFYVAK